MRIYIGKVSPVAALIVLSAFVCAPIGAAPARKAPARIMVPPPPPEMPLVGQSVGMDISSIGVPLDFLSKADLEKMKERLANSLTQLSKRAEERKTSIAESKTRVEQFESLYTEGVVSRRDLQNAKKELREAEETDVDIDQRLADTKSDLSRVEKRLSSLAKPASKPAKPTKVPHIKDIANKAHP